MQLKKLAYLLRYVPYQYKNKKTHNRAILKDSGMLESVPNRYKTQEMCNKAVDIYAHTLEFVPD